jgi:sarcosine oxidase subunit beta
MNAPDRDPRAEEAPAAAAADVVVIGAGVVGSSIAFHLAERGVDVLVIDRNYPMSGTSGSTQAWIWVHTKKPLFYAQFSMLSAELYPDLCRRIGDVEYERTGGLSPLFDREHMKRAEGLAKGYSAAGLEVALVDRDQALVIEPELSPGILGATYSSIDGTVNPFRLVDAYVRAGIRLGARYLFFNPVRAIDSVRNGFTIHAERTVIRAHRLVLAGGPYSPALGTMAGVEIPVFPVKGQIMVTEPLRPLLRHTLSGIRQTKNGEVLIGYSKENAGFDRLNTHAVLRDTARLAVRYVPALADANLLRCFAGIRAIPADELPILGAVPGRPGLYVAVLHSGFTLSPLIGTLMAELLTDGATSVEIDRYSISRFA